MLYQTLFVLLLSTQRSLDENAVIIRNLRYQCSCVLPGNCDDNEPNYAKTHRVLRSAKQCEKGMEECCGAIIPPSPSTPKPSFFQRRKCGIRKVAGSASLSTRITEDSQQTFPGELPWNLLIVNSFKKENHDTYRCGASLIHPKVALTAAHCVESFEGHETQIVVRAGEWNVSSSERKPYKHQESRVKEILLHPKHVKEPLRNDIALVFLIKAFAVDMSTGTICLTSWAETDLPGRCTVSGWGRKEYDTGAYSQILKKVEVPLVRREICVGKWREMVPWFYLHGSFICAGGEPGRDACTGDGGSPLVCWSHQHERFVQTGIVSWGYNCGRDVPGIYVNVGLYLEWIDEAVLSRGLNVSSYKIGR